MDCIIVSGLSGSGKSVALHSPEGFGYNSIDNLPAALLSQFLNQFEPMANGHAAVSIDSRNRQFLKSLPNALAHLRKIGHPARIVFLEATDETLLQRYSETRRKHPLTDATTPLLDGIAVERMFWLHWSSRRTVESIRPIQRRMSYARRSVNLLEAISLASPLCFSSRLAINMARQSTPTIYSTCAVFQIPTGNPNSDPSPERIQ